MDNSQKGMPGNPSAAVVGATVSAFHALVEARGRRGVRIFGLPPDQTVMATTASMLLGIPLAAIVAMAQFWDRVGDFALLAKLNSYVAPIIDGLAYAYRPESFPRLPLKRFLIACASMVELIFLFNIVALFARGVRRHALLVWMCYDRTKIFQYFGISCLIFFGLWYVLFFSWKLWTLLDRRAGLVLYAVVGMPLVAVVFGHMTAIVGLGAWRTASRKLRRLSKAFSG
jgi:hypothetical protein